MSESVTLHEKQLEAVKLACTHRFSSINGPPGSGKTAITTSIIREWCARFPDNPIVTVAPVGKAVDVMETRAARDFASNPEIRQNIKFVGTIDRLIANGNVPELELANVIVDESSMATTEMICEIFKAVRPARTVFVGDANQLGPVKTPNNVQSFFETILSPVAREYVPNVKLTKIYRCENAACGLAVNVVHQSVIDQWSDFMQDDSFIMVTNAYTLDDVVRCAVSIATANTEKPSMVVCYTNAVRERINAELQSKLNHNGAKLPTNPKFRVGDPVVCTSNLYSDTSLACANGCMGKLQRVRNGEIRPVYTNGFTDFEGKTEYELAYCLSIHKSQGSEYSQVVVALDSLEFPTCTRKMLYTAYSRAKELVVIVGSQERLTFALRTVECKPSSLGVALAALKSSPRAKCEPGLSITKV